MNADPDAILNQFQGSPIRRAGPSGLKRNASIVLGNLGDSAARACLMRHADSADQSLADAARWALDRVG